MEIPEHRIPDYVDELEERCRRSGSELLLVSTQVIEVIFLDRKCGIRAVERIREACLRVTRGNFSTPVQDLEVLEHLAAAAVAAGLTDGLHEAVRLKIAQYDIGAGQ